MILAEIVSAGADRISEAATSFAVGDRSLCRERLASLCHFLEVELSALPPEASAAEKQPEEEKEEPPKEEPRPSPEAQHQDV